MTVDVLCPNVFDAGLPTLAYDVTETPAEVYPRIRAAQAQAPSPSDRSGPRSFPTNWRGRCCVTRASRSRPE